MWTFLLARDANSLLVFERLILRRIHGAAETEEGRRIGNGDEMEKLVRAEDKVKYIRAQRIKWWGHLDGMGERKTVRKVTECNHIEMRCKRYMEI